MREHQMSKPKKTNNRPLKAKKTRLAERQAVDAIIMILHKHRAVGEKRLRELTVIAARSVSPELGRAMEKVLIHKYSRAKAGMAKSGFKRPLGRSP
jgi:hypothetical protein